MSGLECRQLAAGYGSLQIVRPLDLSVAAGEVLAILGPNGAGKTTLMNTLAGLLPRLGGDVLVDGGNVPSGKPRSSAKAGMVLVADDRSLFKTLTVAENIKVAAGETDPRSMIDLFPALEKRWKVAAGDTSGGEQQMIAVARGLIQKPKVLLIDEMSMGLAPVIVEELLPIVRHIADDTGTAVVLVEQHVKLALEVADHALVFVHGEVRMEGTADELAADPKKLEAAYLGE